MTAVRLRAIYDRLRDEVDALTFAPPVTHVYNPLRYAHAAHDQYLSRFGDGPGRVLFLGMNPGPWGMAQTGIPFGEVALARDWMGMDGAIGKPRDEHPKREVTGWACERSEVSGRRVWGWAKETFGTAEAFFARFFVANYCPLIFLESSGRNRVPEKLPRAERDALFEACDRALRDAVEALEPGRIVGVGAFAKKRAEQVVGDLGVPIDTILHPSPASPAANRGWAEAAEAQLRAMGVALP